ncbi:MAG: hypothetical protein JSW65_04500 [Candidatus Bipolaricaulota bacterium]|nr:MAG: hypothetical protein JSW65_04500 [Candidatus Bipolaricaulota bacterium]
MTGITFDNRLMEANEFADRLIERITLDEVDFACDVEKLLAEQVKYLRRLVELLAEDNVTERERVLERLRDRVVGQEEQIAQLAEENRALRAQLVLRPG